MTFKRLRSREYGSVAEKVPFSFLDLKEMTRTEDLGDFVNKTYRIVPAPGGKEPAVKQQLCYRDRRPVEAAE